MKAHRVRRFVSATLFLESHAARLEQKMSKRGRKAQFDKNATIVSAKLDAATIKRIDQIASDEFSNRAAISAILERATEQSNVG